MQDYTKFEALVESLRESLKHCQYENFGRPYDKDAQFAFGSNWYGTMADFWDEFKRFLPPLSKEEQKLYCNEVYYKIVWYVILFDHLKADYESKLSGVGNAKLSVETYNLVLAYRTAIRDYLRQIREAATLRGIDLLLPSELTLDSYAPGSTFVQSPMPETNHPTLRTKEKTRRGPYNNKRKEDAINYFSTLLEDMIIKEFKSNREPDGQKIIYKAYKALEDKKNNSGGPAYASRTLNDYLPTLKRGEIFGEIRQRILERIKHTTK